jgi:2-keto-4-pentenoate hydratase/2-oxohepta-3-ene-1,7-dioic acid hydratase in catechol pathway
LRSAALFAEIAVRAWIRFRTKEGGRTGFGVVEGDRICEYAGDVFHDPVATGATLPLAAVIALAPCRPTKVVALWNNFYALSDKLGKAPPVHPLFLIKPAMSVIGPLEAIRRPGRYQGKIAYEGELGIVIGKRCTDVSVEAAAGHIFGFTCVNDVTAIELLQEDPNFAQWCRAKGFDTFSCLGPVVVAGFDWRAASVQTHVDGIERQNYPLADMIFSPSDIVSMISHDMTLEPGDVIACGTSLGVGSIKDGATVEVTIAGIGTLSNQLVAAPAPAAA